MSNNVEVLLVGTGNMGKEYCKVLKAQKVSHVAVGRSEEKAQQFQKDMGVVVISGGVTGAMKALENIPTMAIVAVSVDQLKDVSIELIQAGVKRILVEKPAGMCREDISELNALANEKNVSIFVAYNRRYYASTDKALEIIEQDGGVTSFSFEFTEWGHVIEKTTHSPKVKDIWFLANSTHIADLAFYLGGYPREMATYVGGELDWHQRAAIYAGAGISEKGALFSYQANWAAPGRWAVEILTNKHRLYFKPIEQLAIQNIGSVAVESVELDDSLDKEFKPGLYKEVKAFISDCDDGKRITLQEHLEHIEVYEKMERL